MTRDMMEKSIIRLPDGGVDDPWSDPYLPESPTPNEFPYQILFTVILCLGLIAVGLFGSGKNS